MPPKKGKKGKRKGKGKKKKEPKHDVGWEKTLKNGKWERPLEALPDPTLWPSFAEIREKVLTSCNLISILWSGSMHDDFIAELFSVPRINLVTLELRGARYLTKFIMSPATITPLLLNIDLSCCPNLQYILIESSSLQVLTLSRCTELRKALVQARKLKELNLHETKQLTCLMLWSDVIQQLHFHCSQMTTLNLYCPTLVNCNLPSLKVPKPTDPSNPTVLEIVRVDKWHQQNLKSPREYSPYFRGLKDKKDFVPYATSPLIPHTMYRGF